MQRIRADESLEVLQPELGTKPRVYYKNVHMITKCFVGGTVVRHLEGVEECAAGVPQGRLRARGRSREGRA